MQTQGKKAAERYTAPEPAKCGHVRYQKGSREERVDQVTEPGGYQEARRARQAEKKHVLFSAVEGAQVVPREGRV